MGVAMLQTTLASQASFEKFGRQSKREQFLSEMDCVVPWSELEALSEPHHPRSGKRVPSAGGYAPAEPTLREKSIGTIS